MLISHWLLISYFSYLFTCRICFAACEKRTSLELIADIENVTDWSVDASTYFNESGLANVGFNRVFHTLKESSRTLMPLLLCPIEKNIMLEPDAEIIIFTDDPEVVCKYVPDEFTRHIKYFLSDELPILFKGTPLEKYYNDGGPWKTPWPAVAISDTIRWAATYKYGGAFYDLDLLPMAKVDPSTIPYFVVQSFTEHLASAIYR